MKNKEMKQLETAMLEALRTGSVSVPYLLLSNYSQLSLSETEVMLLVHLMAFLEKEGKEFPTIEEIQSRMSATPEAVIQTLQKLLKGGWMSIDETTDPDSGIRYEKYNLEGMRAKLAAHWAARMAASAGAEKPAAAAGSNLFMIFEKEFARPLTPMELETISGWLDQDHFKEELILAALKEAVFAGKVHFRYIDRILLEWQRNRIQTVDQAKEHAQKFRNSR